MLFGNGVDKGFAHRPYLIFLFLCHYETFYCVFMYFIQMTFNRVDAGCLLKFSIISKKGINRGY